MTYLASALRLGFGASLTLALASACGGNSFSGMSDGDSGSSNGGSSSHAGTGSSGKAHAGSSSTAGSGNEAGEGGSSTTGGTGSSGSGTTGGTGSGGSNPGGACTAPAEPGPCEAAFPRWYHDATTGLCKPFTYGGCQGNANNYETHEACQKACPGGTPNYDACTQPSECALGSLGCCGTCDSMGLSENDFIAYNAKFQNEVYKQCQLVDIACAPCLDPGPYAGTLKYFVPTCEQGQCVVKDIRKTAATACQTETDCYLRSGNGCCPSCTADADVISVNHSGSFEKLVCGNQLPPCAACEPQVMNAFPSCDAGRCSVVYAIPVGTN